MKLYRDLLITLIQANQVSPIITGKIFRFEETTSTLVLTGNKTRFWLLFRWILILILSGEIFFRIALIKLTGENYVLYPEQIQTTLCGLVLCICISIGERYRVRGKRPKELVDFLHQMLFMEARYFKGSFLFIF